MKKAFKAVIAMILVLALGFAVAAPVFAASASATVNQPASIRDFFKKIGESIKKIFDKIVDRIKPDSQPEETTLPTTAPGGDSGITSPASNDKSIVIDDSQDKGSAVGNGDIYASPLY